MTQSSPSKLGASSLIQQSSKVRKFNKFSAMQSEKTNTETAQKWKVFGYGLITAGLMSSPPIEPLRSTRQPAIKNLTV